MPHSAPALFPEIGGQVHGTMAARARMRARDRGTIVNVGSALAYRAIPLQSVYCGAKYAVRGFTDALRSELIHDKIGVNLVMVHLPAINTPQFDWALNRTGQRAQPVPPIYQPVVPACAIFFAAAHPKRREVWVGFSTVKAIIANKLAPGLLDRYLAKAGYSGQLSDEALPDHAPDNLFASVAGDFGAHGRFDKRARDFMGNVREPQPYCRGGRPHWSCRGRVGRRLAQPPLLSAVPAPNCRRYERSCCTRARNRRWFPGVKQLRMGTDFPLAGQCRVLDGITVCEDVSWP